MSRIEARVPAWWVGLNVAVILFSVVFVLAPELRHSSFFLAGSFVLLPVFFVALIWRQKAAGLGDRSIAGIYEQARRGRRLPLSALETATAIALVLAMLKMI